MRLTLGKAHLGNRIAYLVSIVVSLIGAFLLRFDFSIPADAAAHLKTALLIAIPAKLAVFHLDGLHRTWNRFTGACDLMNVVLINVVASVVSSTAIFAVAGREFPRSIYLIDFIVCCSLTVFFMLAMQYHFHSTRRPAPLAKPRKSILIYGAGAAGNMLLREILENPGLGYDVQGFLDDDPVKTGSVLSGVKVLGAGREAVHIVERSKRRGHPIDEIIVVLPSASGCQMREALANCRAAGVACRTLPGIGELLENRVLSAQIRNFSVNDLLGRQPVHLDEARVQAEVAGRSVLITGAGGSIGSELCRQLARFEPCRLVAFDQAESELFRIDLELREKFPQLPVFAELGDIKDFARLVEVCRVHSVDSVYHAAAYKHVPMLENHITEAVRNNILGTWNLLQAARRCGVSNFVMISTDKAVNPASVMGATKRVCEILVSAPTPPQEGWRTRTMAVRFGNVLGSNGSVVPIFQAQIAAGGPVKVTHPEMRRYFMTIPEAVMLVLQAATMAKGSEIFVLDMGEPVRIIDLAQNMLRLAGLSPGEDIEIQFTGLRPGEKLFEELNLQDERILPTYHSKIKIFQTTPLSWPAVESAIRDFQMLSAQRDAGQLLERIAALVSEFRPARQKAVVTPGRMVDRELASPPSPDRDQVKAMAVSNSP
ncbi:MAG: nucleoside-diphosphate sugar epimerase/dehydratase [Bryobacteraceae bacterium]